MHSWMHSLVALELACECRARLGQVWLVGWNVVRVIDELIKVRSTPQHSKGSVSKMQYTHTLYYLIDGVLHSVPCKMPSAEFMARIGADDK